MGLNHLAVIADGNGRWAERRGLPRSEGHRAGRNKIEDLMHYAVDLDIKYLSIFCFSTENWNRPKEEVDELFEQANALFGRRQELKDNNIRMLHVGAKDRISDETKERIRETEELTQDCDGLILSIVANYGGRQEIARAARLCVEAGEEITEDNIGKHLFRPEIPYPDAILRTGGHQRMSNFLMWESAYSELYFTDVLFPDLQFGDVASVKTWFESQKRNFGRLNP